MQNFGYFIIAIRRAQCLSDSGADKSEASEDVTNRTQQEEREAKEVIALIKSSPESSSLVQIGPYVIKQKHFQCLTTENPTSHDKFLLGDEVMDSFIEHICNEKPNDVRDDGTVFLERSTIVKLLELAGRDTNYSIVVLEGSCGIGMGVNYLTHDMIFLPIHLEERKHWILAAVSTRKRKIQVIDSMYIHGFPPTELENALIGMEEHIILALRRGAEPVCTWKHKAYNISKWTIDFIRDVPQQQDSTSCGLYVLQNMQKWTGNGLSEWYGQGVIKKLKKMVPITLVKSPLNKNTTLRRVGL